MMVTWDELKKRLKYDQCDRCYQHKMNVLYIPNPYVEEVDGIIIYEYLCDDCYDKLMDDI